MTTPAYDSDLDRVPLLLHFDGNWQDSSPAGRMLTAANGAVAAETGGVFGTGCADFTATRDAWARTDISIDLAVTGDFSLELQYRPTALVPGTYFLLATTTLSGISGQYIWMYVGGAGALSCYVLGSEAANLGPLRLNEFNGIHLRRLGNIADVWLNNDLVWSGNVTTPVTAPMLWQFGSLPPAFVAPGNGGLCFIDECRLTIGSARQPGQQTAPFANEAAPAVWPSACDVWPAGASFK